MNPWLVLLLVFLGTRLLLWGSGLYAVANHPVHFDLVYGERIWLEVWSHFDSLRYQEILSTGYRPYYLGPAGWFPGYPWSAKPLFWLTGDALLASVLWSSLAAVLGLVLLFKLLRLDLPEERCNWVMVFFLVSPGAFFLTVAYSESTYVLYSCAALLLARKGYWKWAAVLLAATALTRLVGLALVVALVWEYWQEGRRHGKELFLLIALPTLAVLGFFWHLKMSVGSFFAYVQTQKVYQGLFSVRAALGRGDALNEAQWFGLVVTGVCLILLAWGWSEMRGSYRIFTVLSLWMPLMHTQGVCLYRFALGMFPLFMVLEAKIPKRLRVPVALLMLGLQCYLFARWSLGDRQIY